MAPAADDAPSEHGVAVLGSLPEFALTDEAGEAFGRASLEGRYTVSDFIFTTCVDICPMLTREMAKLQGALREDPVLQGVELVSFSVDPERDTPEALRAYASKHDADLTRWSFVTGPRDALIALIEGGFKLSVMVNADAEGAPFLHSDKFVLADPQGRIRGYYAALEPEGRRRLLGDLRRLVTAAPAEPREAGERGARVSPPPPAPGDRAG